MAPLLFMVFPLVNTPTKCLGLRINKSLQLCCYEYVSSRVLFPLVSTPTKCLGLRINKSLQLCCYEYVSSHVQAYRV